MKVWFPSQVGDIFYRRNGARMSVGVGVLVLLRELSDAADDFLVNFEPVGAGVELPEGVLSLWKIRE